MYSLLVVDDEEKIRTIIRKYGEFEGYKITEVSNGIEAIEVCKKQEFDLIILDIMMPRMNGLDASRTIREMKRRDARRVPIIAMSANAFVEDIINSRLAGMNVHLAKPLDAEKMIIALKQCMADNRDIKLHEDL